MRDASASHSTAGAESSYIYWAKSVSNEIADAKAICPKEEVTEVVPIFYNGDGLYYAFL